MLPDATDDTPPGLLQATALLIRNVDSTKTPAAFSDYPYHVYARDGGAFATALWNDVIDARRHRALAEEAARKALKPVSRLTGGSFELGSAHEVHGQFS